MIRTLAIIAAIWCAISVIVTTVWALCGMQYDRRLRDVQVVLEAERIADAEFDRMWGR
jgi:hypothetical protein